MQILCGNVCDTELIIKQHKLLSNQIALLEAPVDTSANTVLLKQGNPTHCSCSVINSIRKYVSVEAA
jgi:hypothetical protein